MDKAEQDPYIILNAALDLVYEGIAISGMALMNNPSLAERRKLNRKQALLELERTDIVAAMNAILADEPYLVPYAIQIAEIVDLTSEVQRSKRSAMTVSAGLKLAGDILDMASGLADV